MKWWTPAGNAVLSGPNCAEHSLKEEAAECVGICGKVT
jgi:hypothetical protein